MHKWILCLLFIVGCCEIDSHKTKQFIFNRQNLYWLELTSVNRIEVKIDKIENGKKFTFLLKIFQVDFLYRKLTHISI